MTLTIHERGPGQWLVKDGDQAVGEFVSREWAERVVALEAERDEARQIVRDIYWMALRYADGRKSYAVGMVNDAVEKGYVAGWLKSKADGGDNVTPTFARDGMHEEWKSLEAQLANADSLNASLTLRLDEVRKVLEPFAKIADDFLPDDQDDFPYGRLAYGHFRAARDWLSATEGEGKP